MWVEERDKDGTKVQLILHEFYAKDVSSKYVVHSRSAFPWSAKRTILTQEVLRVLLNCSPFLPWECTARHVEHMVLKMQYSGYNERFRHDVVKSALNAYTKILALDQSGEKPLYRTREWKREERIKEKVCKKRQWFRRGGYSSFIMVPVTPNSELKRRLDKDVDQSKIKIKIVEKADVSVKTLLQRSNPLKKDKGCGKEDCLVCMTEGKGNCRSSSVTYELKCTSCGDLYVGETARNAYVRGKEHLTAMDNKHESSVMYRHLKEKHNEQITNFTMNVTGVFGGDAMLRQISESVKISKHDPSRLMNNKSEWNFISMPRASIV